MYFINNVYGFVVHDENTKPRIRFVPDVREATPFASWLEADTFAKERVVNHMKYARQYYCILNTDA